MTSKFSQELIDYTVDYLYNDKKTLATACTVAHNWVPPCRLHLFRSLRVRHPTGTSYEDFASFLADSPAIAVNVRRLTIEGDMDNATFPKILTHLPNLRALFLRDWYGSLERAAPPLRNTFKLDYVLLDIGYHQDSEFTNKYPDLFFKYFGGYRTDGKGEEWDEGEEDESEDGGNEDGVNEGDEDLPEVDEKNEEGAHNSKGGEGDVDRISDYEGGTDESGSVNHELEAPANLDWEDLLDGGPGSDYDSEDDVVDHDAYPDATRMVNILSFFSEIKELVIDCLHLQFTTWEIPLSQLPDLIPETRSTIIRSLALTDPIISNSIFAIFYRLLPLSALESLAIESTYYPTHPDFRSIIQEASNLSKFTLFVGEYYDVDLATMGLRNSSSLRSLFISPEHALTSVEGYGSPLNRERLGYASDTDHIHLYDWWGIQALLEAGLPPIHNLSMQIGERADPMCPHHIMQCLRAIDWDWLEDRLIYHSPGFETLTFHFNAQTTDKRGVTEQELENYIREHLPRLQRKGVVFLKKSITFRGRVK